MTAQALQLDPLDDVAIVLQHVAKGGVVTVATSNITLTALQEIPIHHKIALHDLRDDKPLRRGGLVIGKTRQAVSQGAHVHAHNLVSLRASTTEIPV